MNFFLQKVTTLQCINVSDDIAEEAPLEIIVAYGKAAQRKRQVISITMRTPNGEDVELAIGFLFSEGIIQGKKSVSIARYTTAESETSQPNSICIELHPDTHFDATKLQRHFYMSSSCGVCGKASLELVESHTCYLFETGQPSITKQLLFDLPQKLLAAQQRFQSTGGIHAAALFDTSGKLRCLREDVGRHNALDKVLGWAVQNTTLPLKNDLLLLSGRASFELIQKAAMAGIPIVVAIGAPSSLAIELATTHGITLIGFLRHDRFNIYCGAERIIIY
ncbi:MAG: hypothetical protein RLZZ292_3373 [Bacteroidota bacterium]|jgi:FdhD protein